MIELMMSQKWRSVWFARVDILATKNFISCEHSQSPDGRNTECTECLICTDGGFIFSYSRLVLNQETSFYPFVLSDNK